MTRTVETAATVESQQYKLLNSFWLALMTSLFCWLGLTADSWGGQGLESLECLVGFYRQHNPFLTEDSHWKHWPIKCSRIKMWMDSYSASLIIYFVCNFTRQICIAFLISTFIIILIILKCGVCCNCEGGYSESFLQLKVILIVYISITQSDCFLLAYSDL